MQLQTWFIKSFGMLLGVTTEDVPWTSRPRQVVLEGESYLAAFFRALYGHSELIYPKKLKQVDPAEKLKQVDPVEETWRNC